jgi:hypothetical protein
LHEFIYYAHIFYTYLVEEYMVGAFAANRLERLGGLARYQMAVAVAVAAMAGATLGGWSLTAISRVAPDLASATARAKSPSPSQLPSVSQQKEMGDGADDDDDDDGSERSVSDQMLAMVRSGARW